MNKLFAASLLAFAVSAYAYPPPPPPSGGYPNYPKGPGCTGYSYYDVNQWYRGTQSATTRFNLNQICAGHHVLRMVVYSSAQAYDSAWVTLKLNGYTYGYWQETPVGNSGPLVFYIDPQFSTVHYQIQDLAVYFEGSQYVQRIGFYLD